MGNIEIRYETWGDLMAVANDPGPAKKEYRGSREAGEGFSGTKNFPAAMTLCATGWQDGADKARKLSSECFDHISQQVERQDILYDTDGHAIDIARFIDNEPECWQNFTPVIVEGEQHNSKLVKIVYNGACHQWVSQDAMIRKGSAVVALIELLEFSGHRVELVVSFGCNKSLMGGAYSGTDFYVNVKRYDQPLDIGRIAFAVAHPSMFRRVIFSCMEVEARRLGQRVGYGYGTPSVATDGGSGAIYVPENLGEDFISGTAAEKWVLEQLKKQGIELKHAEGLA